MQPPARDVSGPPRVPAALPADAVANAFAGAGLRELAPAVYAELRAIAHRRIAAVSGGRGDTLATTALVHEAYLKLAAYERATEGSASALESSPWHDRSHFVALAALVMRQILIDRARAAKRPGGAAARVTLDEGAAAADGRPEALLELDHALERLATLAPRLARVVVCRFYGGLTEDETATALGLTARTVQRDWVKARAMLHAMLTP